MKKIIITCWIGKYPDYFRAWLNSCKNNKDWDFLVATDQDLPHTEQNVRFIKIDLNDINKRVLRETGIKSSITTPYKICDIKPLYGLIFKEYIRNYQYWGHCDIDMVFGRISAFITDEILSSHERINNVGHLIIYKNCEKINNLYKKGGAIFNYYEVLTSPSHYAFDEYYGMNKICNTNSIKQALIADYADIDVRHRRYMDVNGNNHDKQVYIYENKRLFHCYEVGGKIQREEKLYLHFQKKTPAICAHNLNNMIICKEGFLDRGANLEWELTKYNNKTSSIFELKEILVYYLKKIIQFTLSPTKEKKIEIRRKIYK